MPRVNSYGPWAQRILEELRHRGLLKVEAFRAFLSARGFEVDRTLVQQWCSGATHLPVDVLPHLADHTGRPDLVYAPLVEHADHRLVPVVDTAPTGEAITDEALDLGGAVGRVQDAVRRARAIESAGGPSVTGEEAARVLDAIEAAQRELDELRAGVEAVVSSRPRALGGRHGAAS